MREIVLEYIETFLGYGNLRSPFWLFGMEEGGGNDPAQVNLRFEKWNGKPTEDLPEFSRKIGIEQWHKPEACLQSTWKRLIRIYLNAVGDKVTNDAIRDFQVNRLGRLNDISSPCLFELMPLPSPGLDECPCCWLAEELQLPFLTNRNSYTNEVLPQRIKLARAYICDFKPKVICFYGTGYLPHWQEIAETEFQKGNESEWPFYYACNKSTLFIASLHPTAFGLRNAYFDSIGKFIASKIKLHGH